MAASIQRSSLLNRLIFRSIKQPLTRSLSCTFCGRYHSNTTDRPLSYHNRRKLSGRCETRATGPDCQDSNLEKSHSSLHSKWKSVIGLEIHAQIKSASKLFSGAARGFGASPNTQVSLFDAAIPGTLPVLNQGCVEAAVRTAQALGCRVNQTSFFDRKHYFYADLPAGYQITQYRRPIAQEGELTYVFQCTTTSRVERRKGRLIQIQLEQDSGRSLHDYEGGVSLIDLNRAGVGLMEIVTAPDFTCGDDAASFVRDLRDVLMAIGTCDGKMAEGSLRVDANISVHQPGQPWGTRTEIKNLNSIRSLRLAIESEINRQIEVLEAGGSIENETRSFDLEEMETVAMRDKEKLLDYRFMAEPNLPPVVVDLDNLTNPAYLSVTEDKAEGEMECLILPEQKRRRLEDKYNLPLIQSLILVRQGFSELFECLVAKHNCDVRSTSAVLRTAYTTFLDNLDIDLLNSPISECQLAEVISMYSKGEINTGSVYVVLMELAAHPELSCNDIVEEKQLWLVDDAELISAAIDDILARNPQNVKAYRKGKTNQLKIFTAKVMKSLEGKAKAESVQQMIKDKLGGH